MLVKTLRRTGFLRNKNNSTACSSPTPALPVQHLQQQGPLCRHPKPLPGGSITLPSQHLPQSLPQPHQRHILLLNRSSCTQLALWHWERGMGGRKGTLLSYSPALWRKCLGAGAHEDLWLRLTPPRRTSHCYPVTLKSLSAQASLR